MKFSIFNFVMFQFIQYVLSYPASGSTSLQPKDIMLNASRLLSFTHLSFETCGKEKTKQSDEIVTIVNVISVTSNFTENPIKKTQ